MQEIKVENLVPLKKFILIKPLSKVEETSAGFVMPEDTSANTAPVVGEVLKAGDESQFKEGQLVFFRRFSVDELKFSNPDGSQQVVSLISDDEVVALVNNGQ